MTEETRIQDQVRALGLALAVLRGTAGGYSPQEKKDAVRILDAMYTRAYKQASKDTTVPMKPGPEN